MGSVVVSLAFPPSLSLSPRLDVSVSFPFESRRRCRSFSLPSFLPPSLSCFCLPRSRSPSLSFFALSLSPFSHVTPIPPLRAFLYCLPTVLPTQAQTPPRSMYLSFFLLAFFPSNERRGAKRERDRLRALVRMEQEKDII